MAGPVALARVQINMQRPEQEAPRADRDVVPVMAAGAEARAAAAAAAAASAVVSSSDHDHPGGGAAGTSTSSGGRGAAAGSAAAYDSSDDEMGGRGGGSGAPLPDPHYDENQDAENEAWVFRHMRGGRWEEEVMFQRVREADAEQGASAQEGDRDKKMMVSDGTHATVANGAPAARQEPQRALAQDAGARPPPPDMSSVMMLKPRNSDAVLSCPCCFAIVCMDCQRHVRYANQFRAMFVMNIGVSWHKRLRWDEDAGELAEIRSNRGGGEAAASVRVAGLASVAGADGDNTACTGRRDGMPVAVPSDEYEAGQKGGRSTTCTSSSDDPITTVVAGKRTGAHLEGDDEVYYSVHCASCNTEVAYLNMEDEVYHFVNCLASG